MRRERKGKINFHYRSLIGILMLLCNSTRPDIQFAVNQCDRFSEYLRLSHNKWVKIVCKYFKGIPDKGVVLRPDPRKGIKRFIEAKFWGVWLQGKVNDSSSVLFQTGCVITYAGCSIIWNIKLQTEISIRMTDTECIALS